MLDLPDQYCFLSVSKVYRKFRATCRANPHKPLIPNADKASTHRLVCAEYIKIKLPVLERALDWASRPGPMLGFFK